MARYEVTAKCDNHRCNVGQFVKERKKMTYMGTDDNEYVIRKLVCPGCGMHGQVVSIVDLEKQQEVA